MLVSVIVPVYQRAATVGAAVCSILDQTHTNIEVIVVDDASSDGSADVVQELAARDDRVRLVALRSNAGAQAARNAGIGASKGVWLAFLDSDDRYLPTSVALRLEAAAGARRVVHSECLVARGGGPITSFGARPLEGWVRRELLEAPGPTFPSLLVHRDVMQAIGPLDEAISSFQEWDTVIRLARVSPFAYVPEPTFVWDQTRGDTISSDARRTARGYEQVVRKHLRAIVRSHGPAGLSAHLIASAGWYADAGMGGTALSRAALAGLSWPLAPRRALRAAKRAIRA